MKVVWDYAVELRKELVEAQKIRAQVIGFKITFVTAAFGFMLGNIEKISRELFVLPALAAVFFDFLINSYSFSIKRIGTYIRVHVEPFLEKPRSAPSSFVFWQHYLTLPGKRQELSFIGNLGFTTLCVVVAGAEVLWQYADKVWIAWPLLFVLAAFLYLDVRSFRAPKKLDNEPRGNEQSHEGETTSPEIKSGRLRGA